MVERLPILKQQSDGAACQPHLHTQALAAHGTMPQGEESMAWPHMLRVRRASCHAAPLPHMPLPLLAGRVMVVA